MQLHAPISLDPPAYHLLSHLSMDAIGRNAIALRLPALAGFLLLQLSLFLLVRRLAGYRAALIAMILPVCTASFRYAAEGRPYGLLLGLYASSLLCWFTAAARSTTNPAHNTGAPAWRERSVPLFGLFLSIALAISSHYFGILILLPVSAAEAVRSLRRRHFDWPVVAALAAGFASIVLILPGKAALKPYQRHYYTGSVNLHNVSQGYREIFLRYNAWPMPLQRIAALLLAAATLALVWAAIRRFRQGPQGELAATRSTFAQHAPASAAEKSQSATTHAAAPATPLDAQNDALWPALWTALVALAVLPFFGYLFGKFVTHTMEVRYVIAALIPFVVCAALLLERTLRSTRAFAATLAAVGVFAIAVTAVQIRAEQQRSAAILAGMTIPTSLHDELAAHPAERLYTQSLGDFFLDGYYGPDPLLRDRITLVYDEPSEVRWLHHNTNAVTADNLNTFSTLPTRPYTAVLAEPGALLLDYGSGWEWIGNDLRTRHIPVQQRGPAAGARLEQLNGPTHE